MQSYNLPRIRIAICGRFSTMKKKLFVTGRFLILSVMAAYLAAYIFYKDPAPSYTLTGNSAGISIKSAGRSYQKRHMLKCRTLLAGPVKHNTGIRLEFEGNPFVDKAEAVITDQGLLVLKILKNGKVVSQTEKMLPEKVAASGLAGYSLWFAVRDTAHNRIPCLLSVRLNRWNGFFGDLAALHLSAPAGYDFQGVRSLFPVAHTPGTIAQVDIWKDWQSID